MIWDNLYPTIQILLSSRSAPDVIVIHCGGNNIGHASNTLRGLQKFVKATLADIAHLLPNTAIVWSHILPRIFWLNCIANAEGEKCRRRINSSCATFVIKSFPGRGASISYPDISPSHQALFRRDGVHLSELGNSLFVNTLSNALDHFRKSNFSPPTFP
jgi:lysophospholipase L1-like esterase